ncbi:MAG: hypothetical protein KME19_05845 [Microcoleus vaginatus WJT46-NPBG5]|jgi:hypothetical protein|nr:hypothetical protein [Microcoleus vaginatus WJT46-NPBG5]
MIKHIKLMPDFGGWPLWEYEDRDLVDNLHPSELPLNEETVKRLLQWQQTYEGIMNWDDPHSAGFASETDRIAFEEEGIRLWQQLQKELGNDWEVCYFSELQGNFLKTPTELLSRQ